MKQQPSSETSSKWGAKQLIVRAVTCLLVLSGIVLSARLVLAQTEATSEAEITPYTQQLAELAQTYRGQLQEYQTKERAYIIAKTDFIQLETLASLEEVVRASREATIIRDQVLETYLQQLRVTLVATPGVDVAAKQRALDRLETLLEVLELHRQVATEAQNRDQIKQVSDAFELVVPELENTTYFALALIEFGRLRSVSDQTLDVFDQWQEQDTSQLSQTARSQRDRNIKEIEDQFSFADQQFKVVFETIIEDEQKSDEDSFRQLKTDLNEVYAQLTRIQNFLDEVI